jgi:hypothetical protein
MSGIAPQVWTRLEGEQIQGETLWARRAAPETTDRLIAALDADGKRHLLILLLNDEPNVQDKQSRGIGAFTRQLTLSGHEPGRYIDITCQDPAGIEAFDLIGGELAERLAGTEPASECVTRVLAKWRRFWTAVPQQMLSTEKLIGVLAELWFLCYWLCPKAGVGEAVQRWRGPFSSRHDFEWPGCSIEVKATTSTRGRIHWINGIDQLAPPDAGELLLFSLRLRQEAGGNTTLVSVIEACRETIGQEPEALTRLEEGLGRCGYSPAHDDEYAQLRFRIVDGALFQVRDDFPRITSATFPTGAPVGVEHVEYEINLETFAHLRLAQHPGDAFNFPNELQDH